MYHYVRRTTGLKWMSSKTDRHKKECWNDPISPIFWKRIHARSRLRCTEMMTAVKKRKEIDNRLLYQWAVVSTYMKTQPSGRGVALIAKCICFCCFYKEISTTETSTREMVICCPLLVRTDVAVVINWKSLQPYKHTNTPRRIKNKQLFDCNIHIWLNSTAIHMCGQISPCKDDRD